MHDMCKCHICQGELVKLNDYSAIYRVTSDCRPWKKHGMIAVCQQCNAVQKPITQSWLNEVKTIYSEYEVYAQGGGLEQLAFNKDTGIGHTRSQKIVSWLSSHGMIANSGTMLDIGCGNGSFLRCFGNHYPEWQMTGLELNDRHQEVIESIAGVTHFYAGDIERLNERFDLIVLIHALEHIPFPISYLHQVAQHLKPGGLLFIEVPHLDSSPFDITIADHCTHFTSSILRIVITQAGFNVLGMTTNCVPKELSLLAQAPTKGSLPLDQPNNSLMANASILDGERTASGHITWLNQLLQQSQSLNGKVGVFGTSIAATWLASQLDGQISFFVDEDDNRTGHHYMSCPVYKPEHVPTGVPILLPLRPDIALSITKRLDSLNINFILPPSP